MRTYNDRFNAIVLRSYDEAQPALPGLALSFEPRPHQLAAVARMVAEPATLLAHEVGAGKTAAMAMGVMELKRLGLAAKPALVVPNHMVEQFSREFLQLYPQARLLVGTKEDLAGSEGRRRFTARAATGEWDAVIVSHSAFERIPLSESARGEYLGRERDRVCRWLDNSKQRGGLSVKRLERKLLEAEERLKRRLETGKADEGITFEQTGIDYLCVDEAHLFKNLATSSNIPGASIEGSERAQDLDMKLDWLRRRKPGGRIVTFATATPVANSITEAYVVQRYLRPDLLEEAGIEDFDTWAATFGEVVSGVELTPDATTFRIKSRFAKFTNVPELLTMLHVAADVKTAEDLGLPTPTLPGGGPETVVVASSPELAALVAELGERAEAVRSRAVRPEEDNMLKISGDGRAAALDLRLISRERPEGPTKIDVAAEHITAIWAEHRHDRYLDTAGEAHPRPGALQLVFCELGTPAEHWNVYDELRAQLVARGIPTEAVRFIHEAKDDRAKAELFAACRAGSVAVLVGSTEKMGVGTNVQDRAVALHHLDCPWRPADLAQRDGRILRQGNQNPEVRVLRYVTEGSFDTYMWQTVERKARFIGQLMRGRLDVRDIEDIGDAALSYAEVKALAAGDPRLIEAAQVDAEVAKLERLARAWARNQDRLRRQVAAGEHHIAGLQVELAQAEAAAAHPVDLRGERFTMSVEGRPYRRRGDAGAALIGRLSTEASRLSAFDERRLDDLGELGGQRLVGTVHRDSQGRHAELSLEGVPRSRLQLPEADLHPGRAAGVIARLEHRLEAIPTLPETIGVEIAEARREQDRARAGITERFPHAERLADVQERSAQLAAQLAELASPHHDTADSPAQLCATYERLTAEERATRIRAAITPGLPPDAVERVLEAVERAELAGADPTGLCCRAGLGALAEEDLLHQITNQTYSARPQAAYAGILPPPAPSTDPAISEQLHSIGCQLETWREELAQQLDSTEPPPQWAAPLGRPPADPATRSAWATHVAQVGLWRAARRLTENDLYGPEHDLPPLLAAARARAVAAGRDARQAATDSQASVPLTRPARPRHPSPSRPQLPAVRMRP